MSIRGVLPGKTTAEHRAAARECASMTVVCATSMDVASMVVTPITVEPMQMESVT